MATKKNRKPAKKIKSLRAKTVGAKQAKTVKGGDRATFNDLNITHTIDKTTPILFTK
jgi:type VI protein secretion system component Hcp